MNADKMSLLIADDEEEFRNAFMAKHSGTAFDIEQFADIHALPEYLAAAKELPDLVVIDLYRTMAEPGTNEAKVANAEVDDLLAKLDAITSELKVVVNRVKTPAAIHILREIRAVPRLADIPILIYTRQGLSLLSDDEIRDAIHLGAEWMLKGRSASVERAQMTAFLRAGRIGQKRLKRDVALTLLGTILDTVLGAVCQWLI